jgi:cytochrome b
MQDQVDRPRVWDPIVKLTHWGVVAAVIWNAIFTEEGSGWHIWVGYGLAGLLVLRLLWGFIGPAEARFSAFPPSPARALAHLGEIRRGEVTRHRSHNPLGAMMAYAIWATLLSSRAAASPCPARRPPIPRQSAAKAVKAIRAKAARSAKRAKGMSRPPCRLAI